MAPYSREHDISRVTRDSTSDNSPERKWIQLKLSTSSPTLSKIYHLLTSSVWKLRHNYSRWNGWRGESFLQIYWNALSCRNHDIDRKGAKEIMDRDWEKPYQSKEQNRKQKRKYGSGADPAAGLQHIIAVTPELHSSHLTHFSPWLAPASLFVFSHPGNNSRHNTRSAIVWGCGRATWHLCGMTWGHHHVQKIMEVWRQGATRWAWFVFVKKIWHTVLTGEKGKMTGVLLLWGVWLADS